MDGEDCGVFGSVVNIVIAISFAGIAHGENGVAGELELIGNGEEVGGFHVRVGERLAVKVAQRID